MDEKNLALEAIRKKLVGKKLSYREIYAIMDEIAKDKLGDIITTYFVASGYSKGFSNNELYYLTKAMVETGERLHFSGLVADKHSIGGVPGTRVTLILVPIVAAAGFKIPKSSSRAITTPAGTADVMEALSPVTFSEKEIYKIVTQTNGCIVWGGGFKIAPADDDIIKIEEPLLFESYDKIVVSVMAKKVAFGATHVVVDLPYGSTAKIHRTEDAEILKKKFEFLGKKFGIKIHCLIHKIEEPAGYGIGPTLEARDSLKVLEQADDKSAELEKLAIEMSSVLLSLCLEDANVKIKQTFSKKYKDTKEWARDLLQSGRAIAKFREIIKAQGGNPDVTAANLRLGRYSSTIKFEKRGKITSISSTNITLIAKVLGAPVDKQAGICLLRRLHERVERGDGAFVLYSDSEYRLKEARDSLALFPIYDVEK